MDVYKPVYPGLYYFDTFAFTTLGTSGHRGPDSTKTYANAPWSADQFSIIDGQQQWTVPATGTYLVTAAGAYGATPGRVVSGEVDLNEGQVVSLLVGQQPNPLTANVADNVTVGGGGGTFVTVEGKPLIVASGGDGGTSSTQYNLLTTQTFASSSFATINSNGSTIAITDGSYTYIYRNYTLLATLSPGGNSVSLSSDGNKVALSTNEGHIILFSYLNDVWTQTQVATLYGSSSVSLSSDGNVLMAMGQNEVYTYVYSNYLWIPTHINDLYAGNAVSISLSGDGNTGFVSTYSFQVYAKLYSVNRTGTVWSLGTVFSRNFSPYVFPRCATNFDGTVACYMERYTGKIYIYTNSNGNWSEYLINTSQIFYNYGISLSSDGNILSFIKTSGYVNGGPLVIYRYLSGTWSLTYTIPQPNNDSNFGTFISMNSATNKIVITGYYNVYTYTQPIPQSGLFLPSGSGFGGSAAGYLTDGQVSDPYFAFLKPQAYIDGGFGSAYQYGHQGEGGFGGGQSPIGLLTLLTSISGSANVYPSISGSNMCMSSDNSVVLVKNLVYRYSNGNWSTPVTLQLYSLLTGSTISRINALSGNGNRAFVSQFSTVYVYNYSGGSWSSGTLLTSDLTSPSVSVTSDGNTAFVCGYDNTGLGHALIYKYNGSSWSSGSELPWSVQPERISASSMSSDGSTAVYASQSPKVDIFKYSGGVWSLSTSIPIFATCFGLTTDGNTIIAGTYNNTAYVFKYSGGSWSSTTIVNNNLTDFGKTVDISSDGTFYYIGSTSKLSIYKNGVLFSTINGRINEVKSSGSSVAAYSTGGLGQPVKIIFLNTSSLTTTCTATTSSDHGYPHDYKVLITNTSLFNGTWDIVTTSSNTFTFQAFGGPTETSGYVSGTTTGISGGGGYTGSPGDGVSGATCYGAGTITDLGATSNSAGYVTVSLVDPITLSYSDAIIDDKIYISPSGFAYWYDIVYSPELKLFVSCSSFYNGQGIVFSNDGKTWYRSDYNGPGPLCLGWSPDLGLFVVGTSPYYNNQISSNGINWTSVDSQHRFRSIQWVPFLHKFIGVEQYQNLLESSDGVQWDIIYSSPYVDYINNYSPRFISTSSSNVIACINSTVYISNDGVNWTLNLTTTGDVCTSVYGNGTFFVVTSLFYYYYSSDEGQTWSNGILPYTQSANYISSVFTDSLIVVTGDRETFTSRDYSTWTRYPNNTMNSQSGGYHASVYSGQYIVAVSDREISLSLDGSIWAPADQTFIGAVYDNVAYSPETNTVVAVASNGQVSTETGVYTKDGITWKQIPGLSFYPKVCRWNPLQGLFFLDNYAFDPVSESLLQTSYREWIESTTPPQLLQSYYQQGLNNNLPIGKAFSLGGIIVDTGATVSSGYRLSCSGDVFIKMGRNPSGTAYRSTDGTNWESYQLQGDVMNECNRVIYVSKYNAFFSLSGQEGRVYKSYDSVNWSLVYQSPGIYLSEMLWCSTMNKILLFSIANNLTELTFST